METTNKIIVDLKNERLDKYLSKYLNISRERVNLIIKNNLVFINKKNINKPSYIIKNNDIIEISNNLNFDCNKKITLTELNECSNPPKLDIVYEDNFFMIVNKPNDVLVYPVYSNDKNTLAHSLKQYFLSKNNFSFKNDIRQGIVHRLDRKTTGLVLVGKTPQTTSKLQKMIRENKIRRKYLCLVHNNFQPNELGVPIKIDAPIKYANNEKYKMKIDFYCKKAKPALTIMTVLKTIKNKYALVENDLITGRTHQVRLHMKYINHPIINDELYGIEKKFTSYGQYLMCSEISFYSPFDNNFINISLPLENEFKIKIKELENA